ncbi:MAG: hypothetical protein MJY62_03725 [Bacteroidales bacterium]|nr:hypothetical protein [Bacteroidales bacterium]
MKRYAILIFAAAIALISSCDYKQEISRKPTRIAFSVYTVQSNYADIYLTPEDDRVFYTANIIRKDEFEAAMKKMSEQVFMEKYLDSARAFYNNWRRINVAPEERYVATFEDYMMHYSTTLKYFTNLKPETDYFVYAFCVDTDRMIPLGELQKFYLRTPPISSEAVDFQMHFLVKENNGIVSYYVKPITNGHLSRTPYVAAIVSAETLDDPQYEYNGDLNNFVDNVAPIYNDMIEYFALFDISRSPVGFEMEEGKEYIVWGYPFVGNYRSHVSYYRFVWGSQETEYVPGLPLKRK